MTEPEHHDWPKLIAELNAKGVTAYKLATMMGRQLVQVQRWADGSEPRHAEGERLLAIHAEYCGDTDFTIVIVPNTQTP